MKKLLVGSALAVVVGLFVFSLPSGALAQSERNNVQARVDARLDSITLRLCDRLSIVIARGLPITLPSICTPVPPPVDMCLNVPGTQITGPCADALCVIDGGTWDGDSCEMPPPPPVDVCPNVPGNQAVGPCADTECVADGGTWNGTSCVMPPIDVCPNVPGLQEDGPCADVECVEDGGVWNGTSCDMPPPPPVDQCQNVPGMQESGPCADDICEEDGGTWNGTSCDMPPVDECPNVPDDQATGPCADELCETDGGTWNGTSCDMPAPPISGVIVNEIMYDPNGNDGDREWIEIKNGTEESVDMTGWFFVESGFNRALTFISGNPVIPAGGFAIIAKNSDVFLAEWPTFSGTIFDSTSFTMVNSSEVIGVKDSTGVPVDEMAYSSSMGANDDGNSLQRTPVNTWIAALPTPGAENAPDALPNSL